MLEHRPRGWRRFLLIATLTLLTVMDGTAAASAAAASKHEAGAVTAWARRHAHPVATVEPTAPLDDLAPLRRSIGDATIVGLGESIHGVAEESTLKHRVLRFLVEDLGFRSVGWEEDWTTGLEIDAYIHGGPANLAELMARMSPQYQTAEVAGVLRWLRTFNAQNADQVRFVGVEYYFTSAAAYDAVDAYVAATAPDRLDELHEHLEPLRPTSPDPFEHIASYSAVEDKQPYLDHAHAVRDLVAGIPHRPDDAAHDLALHNAEQIVSFYEHYSLPEAESLQYREAHAAANLRWWQHRTGDRVAYWAASAHTADAPDLHIVDPSSTDRSFASAGSYLARWYGEGYLSIGFTLDHGTARLGPDQTAELPPPDPAWFEHPLGAVGEDQFLLDLRQPAPTPVRRWLHEPTRTRGLPDAGPDSYIEGGSLARWFDVIVHRRVVTAAGPA